MYFSKSKFRFVVQFCLVAFSLSLTFLSFWAEKRIFLDVGNIDGHVRLTFSLGDKSLILIITFLNVASVSRLSRQPFVKESSDRTQENTTLDCP